MYNLDLLDGTITLYYLLREQGRLSILKFLPHPVLVFHVINEKILPTMSAYYLLFT